MKKIVFLIAVILAFVSPGLAFGENAVPWNKEVLKEPLDPVPAVTRFWSNTYKGHFYTADASEAAYVDTNYPNEVWSNEGAVFRVYNPLICEGAPPGICIPVYRFWSDTYRHHFYTISESERDSVAANMPEWRYEGVVYAANTGAYPYPYMPLYRFWSNTYRGHFYTTSDAEKTNIMNNMSEWQYEGIAYYVIDLNYGPS